MKLLYLLAASSFTLASALTTRSLPSGSSSAPHPTTTPTPTTYSTIDPMTRPTTTPTTWSIPTTTTYPAPSCWLTTVISPTPSAGSGGTVQLWSQCGGFQYTGPSSCGIGATCVYVNQFYSQCQPQPVTSTLTVCS